MLIKCKSKNNKKGGVLVKFPKKKQDLRIDLPTVGLKTFKLSKTAGLKGIVLKNKQHMIWIYRSGNFYLPMAKRKRDQKLPTE